jgi:hypothetical protein
MDSRVNINLTWSKIMAFAMLIASVYLTVELRDITPFSIAAPLAAALILGKQGQRVLIAKFSNGNYDYKEEDTMYNKH